MSPAEIKEKWRLNAQEASNRGTWTHWQCERFLNKQLVDTEQPEMTALISFLSTLTGCRAYRSRYSYAPFACNAMRVYNAIYVHACDRERVIASSCV